jgi:hypothetical protein
MGKYWTVSTNDYGQTVRTITAEGNAYMAQHRRMPPDGDGVRADSAGELEMFERVDDSGRKIREFRGDKASWMNAHKAIPQLMLGINKDGLAKDVFERQCKQRWQDKQALANQINEHGLASVQTQSISEALAGAGDAAFVRFGGSASQ